MTDWRKWAREAVESVSADGSAVQLLHEDEASQVLARGQATFVNGDPASWAYALKYPWERAIECQSAREAAQAFAELIPETADRCLIALETMSPEQCPVIETPRRLVPALLAELPRSEVYAMDRSMQWIVLLNHHNTVIRCYAPPT